MRRKMLYGVALFLVFATTLATKPVSAADTLVAADFKLESWSKTIDFFDYVRAYAPAQNKPPSSWHAYLYMNYINVSGFQLLYGGLVNITKGEGTVTIPIQTFVEHYKTPQGKHVVTSSSFVMLLAFNDTTSSLYANSPDRHDNLYASFSLGFNLNDAFGSARKPALSSQTTIIPLTHTGNTWSWGMKYTNLTAIWWRMHTDPLNPHYDLLPIAITTYEELTFTYNLEINPTDNTATLTANYIIGRMTNLWLIHWLLIFPIVVHYNSTGTYRLNGTRIADETIYQFLQNQGIKMSVVLFQNSLVLDHTTKSTSSNAQNVTDAEVDVSDGAVTTRTEDDEKIFEAEFGTKQTYKLYNCTADTSETDFETYEAVTRTTKIAGYARNPIFGMHTSLLRFIPFVIYHMRPALYLQAMSHIANMTYADYFYLISYPTYSGFRVEHDPTYTAYILITPSGAAENLTWQGLILLGIGGAATATIIAIIIVRRRSHKTPEVLQPPTTTTETK